MRTYDERMLKTELKEFLTHLEECYNPRKINAQKAIHDSVHGTQLFQPHEVALIDLPIVQRLRRISQTDVASLVFPTANHNRLEHTIGVATVAGQMIEAIYKKHNDNAIKLYNKDFILNNVRFAALLHDVGHGPFSHLSEQLYSKQLESIKKNNPILRGGNPHEILSYFIVTSEYMRRFNSDVIKKTYNIEIDLDFVAEMIVGYIDKAGKQDRAYAVDLINGAFDADKLDYILRDSHAAGLKLSLDVHRLFYTLNVIKVKDVYRLAIDMSGVAALEQIIFNKMNLFSIVYHHQKIRAAGCQLRSIIERVEEINTPIDFLRLDDSKIIGLDDRKSCDKNAGNKLLFDFKNRVLPARALLISKRTTVNSSSIASLMELFKDGAERESFIEKIIEALSSEGVLASKDQIWVDFPKVPEFKETKQCYIISKGSPEDRVLLCEVFPSDQWAVSFVDNKWQGFIFAERSIASHVSKVAIKILKEDKDYNIEFNDYATSLCKLA